MVSGKVVVANLEGLEAVPASRLVMAVKQSGTDVKISCHDKEVNGASLIGLISLAIRCGDEIEIKCTGEGEAEALKNLIEMVERGL